RALGGGPAVHGLAFRLPRLRGLACSARAGRPASSCRPVGHGHALRLVARLLAAASSCRSEKGGGVMAELAADAVDVCVCTFRRPALSETLRSLAALQHPEGYRVGIIVADNDEVPSARDLVLRLARELDLPVRYIHCPARNISIARNACL